MRAPCLVQGLPSFDSGDIVMDDQSNTSHPAPRKILKPRRLVLLASVAGLGIAVLGFGPSGYGSLNIPAWTASAHAAEAAQTLSLIHI